MRGLSYICADDPSARHPCPATIAFSPRPSPGVCLDRSRPRCQQRLALPVFGLLHPAAGGVWWCAWHRQTVGQSSTADAAAAATVREKRRSRSVGAVTSIGGGVHPHWRDSSGTAALDTNPTRASTSISGDPDNTLVVRRTPKANPGSPVRRRDRSGLGLPSPAAAAAAATARILDNVRAKIEAVHRKL